MSVPELLQSFPAINDSFVEQSPHSAHKSNSHAVFPHFADDRTPRSTGGHNSKRTSGMIATPFASHMQSLNLEEAERMSSYAPSEGSDGHALLHLEALRGEGASRPGLTDSPVRGSRLLRSRPSHSRKLMVMAALKLSNFESKEASPMGSLCQDLRLSMCMSEESCGTIESAACSVGKRAFNSTLPSSLTRPND